MKRSRPPILARHRGWAVATVIVAVGGMLRAQDAGPGPFEIGKGVPGPSARGWLPPEEASTAVQCSECHVPEGKKWHEGFRPTAFSNAFVQAEYKLAWAKAKQDETGDSLPASCLACHSPLQYLQGNIPGPGEKLANDDGIVCDFCHSTWGFDGDTPGNYNWIFRKGGNRFGPEIHSALGRDVRFTKSPELCGTCHNERGPGGHWVKSVYDEWKEGPYSKAGEKGCLDCHKRFTREFVDEMIAGSVEVKILPPQEQPKSDRDFEVSIELTNIKGGHSIPTGSSELRQLWLHVEVVDAQGRAYPLRVSPKGFTGEESTIGSEALAYHDLQELKGEGGASGLPRDGEGISLGDRVFRLPMFDRKGRMTAFEWNAYSLGPDYRLRPRQPVLEKYRWTVPSSVALGDLHVRATLRYRRAPPSVWSQMGLSASDNPSILAGEAQILIEASHSSGGAAHTISTHPISSLL